MNIKLKPVDKADGGAFYFTPLPESVKREFEAKMQSFDVISKGTVKVPKGEDARVYSWSGEFFGRRKRNDAVVSPKYWTEPKECVKTLRGWLNGGAVLKLTVSGMISINVTISSLTVENYGAFGNVKYSIKLVQYRKLKIYTTKELKVSAFVKKTKERDTAADPASGGSYTTVSGDTLWKIAASRCGGGSNWTKLYSANRDVIEAAAKSHGKSGSDNGNLIWPGTTLTLV